MRWFRTRHLICIHEFLRHPTLETSTNRNLISRTNKVGAPLKQITIQSIDHELPLSRFQASFLDRFQRTRLWFNDFLKCFLWTESRNMRSKRVRSNKALFWKGAWIIDRFQEVAVNFQKRIRWSNERKDALWIMIIADNQSHLIWFNCAIKTKT